MHGVAVTCKGRTLKRASTIVKHSRFMRNLVVAPRFPEPPKEAVPEAGADQEQPAE